jgi:hypothetical protein
VLMQQIFRFLHKFLQCERRLCGTLRDILRQQKTPRALISLGVLGICGTFMDLSGLSGGGDEEDRTPTQQRVAAGFQQPGLQRFLLEFLHLNTRAR